MKLFGSNWNSSRPSFDFSSDNREWVEDALVFLASKEEAPTSPQSQIILGPTFFPESFKLQEPDAGILIDDICGLLKMDANEVFFEMIDPLAIVPFESHGRMLSTEVIYEDEQRTILIPAHLLSYPSKLIALLTLELIQMDLIDKQILGSYDKNHDTLCSIVGIWKGFGHIFLQNMSFYAREISPFWQQSISLPSTVDVHFLIYALVCMEDTFGHHPPSRDLLSKENLVLSKAARKLRIQDPLDIFDRRSIELGKTYQEIEQKAQSFQYEEAIHLLNHALKIEQNPNSQSTIYNNIGYYMILIGSYEESLPQLEEAIKMDPEMAYAYSNVALALILLDRMEEGLPFLQQAQKMDNHDPGYVHRNYALYFQKKGDFEAAENHFQLAKERERIPIDLYELHYGNFLLSVGEIEEGKKWIKKGADQGEPQATRRWKELQKES
ncbi:MAG: tetratricopeptide repeat protein [Bacteroidota bacterium]